MPISIANTLCGSVESLLLNVLLKLLPRAYQKIESHFFENRWFNFGNEFLRRKNISGKKGKVIRLSAQ